MDQTYEIFVLQTANDLGCAVLGVCDISGGSSSLLVPTQQMRGSEIILNKNYIQCRFRQFRPRCHLHNTYDEYLKQIWRKMIDPNLSHTKLKVKLKNHPELKSVGNS